MTGYQSKKAAALDKLAQPEQEPVAYRSRLKTGSYTYCITPQFFDNAEPLYTAPPQRTWVGLTRTELIRCGVLPFGMSYQLYEAIEAKLKEKNNG